MKSENLLDDKKVMVLGAFGMLILTLAFVIGFVWTIA